jgi:virulence-associated protein E
VSDARRGSRNDTLNKAAFCAGQMIGVGALTRGMAEGPLKEAAHECGLGAKEARDTINSGIGAGMLKPLEQPFFVDMTAKGGVEARSLHNVIAFLDWCGVTLRWNAFVDRYKLTGVKGQSYLSDKSTTVLWGKAQGIGFKVDKHFLRDCLEATALEHQVHPVRGHFRALGPWDGIARLDNWLTAYLGAHDNEYVRAVGAKTLIAAVRRIKRPGTKFDQLRILEDKQATGKSSAIKCLATACRSCSRRRGSTHSPSRQLAHLLTEPALDHGQDARPIGLFERAALGYAVPFGEAAAAAGGGRMLGDEHRVAAVGCLLAVVRWVRGAEPLIDKIARVRQHGRKPARFQVGAISRRQPEAPAETRAREAVE